MAKLKQEHKIYLVEQLACFGSPSEVRESFKALYDIDLGLPQITKYDPTTANGEKLAKKLKEVFAAIRKRFIENTSDIPIAHKAWRLRRLTAMVIRAGTSKNSKLEAALLEQGAKDAGGAFTNKRELSGPNGAPLAITAVDPVEAARQYQDLMRGGA